MVLVFVNLANVIVDGGFAGALIQKKDADALDFSSVLYFTLSISVLMYAVLFFCAPLISSFYGRGYEILTPVMRVIGVQVIIFAVNSVQQAYVARQMMFRNFFWATLVGTCTSAIVGLVMAYAGYGIWAIVAQQLTSASVNTFTLYLITGKLPVLGFSSERLKTLLSYGIKLFGASVLITGYQEVRGLIIGKLYSARDLAFFDRGRQFPFLISNNINISVGSVLFPKMSKEQDDIGKIKNSTRLSIRFSAFAMCPLMLGLAAIAEPAVRLLLTDKWLGCVHLMRWFCIVYLFQPIHTANMQAIKAIGRSDVFLKLEVFKKILELLTLLAVMWISVDAIVINMAVLTTLFTVVNAYPNRKLLNYDFKEQISDIMSPVLMSVVMMSVILVINRLIHIGDLWMIMMDILVGGVVYLGLAAVTKNSEFAYLTRMMINKIKSYGAQDI